MMSRKFGSRGRAFIVGLVVVAVGSLVASGCLFSQGTNGGDDDDGGDAMVDAGEDAMSACMSDSECERPNVESECNEGTCEFTTCVDGYEDLDDNLSNGCECRTENVSTAYADCDGDGFAATPGGEDGRTTEYCADGSGMPSGAPSVCGEGSSGTWVPTDPSTGGEADCDDGDAQVHPGYPGESSSYEENWLCDGKDNDCDDTVDEPCCTTDGGDSYDYGDGNFDVANGSLLRVTEPADGAPEEAVALAVWESESGVVKYGHLDTSGDELGDSDTADFREDNVVGVPGGDIRRIAIVTVGSGYQALVAVRADLSFEDLENWDQSNRDALYSLAIPDAGNLAAAAVSEDPLRRVNEIGGLQLTAEESPNGRKLTVVGSIRPVNDGVTYVRGCQFTENSPGDCGLNQPISDGSYAATMFPQLVEISDGYVAGWWNDNGGIELKKLSPDFDDGGDVVSDSPTVDVDAEGETGKSIELLAHGSDGEEYVDVVYPSFDSEGNANLVLDRRTTSDLNSEDEFELTGGGNEGASVSHEEPSAVVNSERNELVVSWREIRSGETALATARYGIDEPTSTMPDYLLDAGLGDLEQGGVTMSAASRGAVVGWPLVTGATLEGHYLSPGGKPICTPTSSSGS